MFLVALSARGGRRTFANMTPLTVRERIEAYNAGRDPARLVRKYTAMRTDPFLFFRGTAHLFWEDWANEAGALADAPLAWACGDLHLENFGSFRGDNGLVYFDLNDFDEAALAPATADVARLLASTHLAARALGLPDADATTLCDVFLDAYAAALIDGKARWVERSTATGMVRDLLRNAQDRRRKDLLRARTVIVRARRRLRIDGQRIEALARDERGQITECIHEFAESGPGAATNARAFQVLDVARRIAGTGSLGVRRYVVLTRGDAGVHGQLLLDLKQAGPSSLAANVTVPQPRWRNPADRVVRVQHRMQAVSAALLAAVTVSGAHFVLRELQPTEDRLALGGWNGKFSRLRKVLATMGHLTAWSQLRSASRQGAAGIDDFIAFGQAGALRRRVLAYARDYAATAERDWREFSAAERALER